MFGSLGKNGTQVLLGKEYHRVSYPVGTSGGCMGCHLACAPPAGTPSATHSRRCVQADCVGGVMKLGPAPTGHARNTDPETSQVAAVTAQKETVAQATLRAIRAAGAHGCTGSEIAASTGKRLNSVTPRFADLNLLIKDSGIVRNGQTVWVSVDLPARFVLAS